MPTPVHAESQSNLSYEDTTEDSQRDVDDQKFPTLADMKISQDSEKLVICVFKLPVTVFFADERWQCVPDHSVINQTLYTLS